MKIFADTVLFETIDLSAQKPSGRSFIPHAEGQFLPVERVLQMTGSHIEQTEMGPKNIADGWRVQVVWQGQRYFADVPVDRVVMI